MTLPHSAVTLEEAKKHLRIDHDLDDEYIAQLCEACTRQCEHELERSIFGESGLAETVADVPKGIKIWVLLHVGTLYENRDSGSVAQVTESPYLFALIQPYKCYGSINDPA